MNAFCPCFVRARERKIFTALADIFLIIIITKFLIPNSTIFRAPLFTLKACSGVNLILNHRSERIFEKFLPRVKGTILFIMTIIDNIHIIDFELETLLVMKYQNDQFLQCLATPAHAGHSLDKKCNAFNPHFDESQKIGDTTYNITVPLLYSRHHIHNII